MSLRSLALSSLLAVAAAQGAAAATIWDGFVPPLGAGDYAFWMQQTSNILTSYSFDVVVVPEPSVASLLMLGLVGLAIVGRRRA